MGPFGLVVSLIASALLIYPLIRICARAGLPRWPAFLVFVPFIGWFIVAYLLAFSRWPTDPHFRGPGA